ncbi:MAG: ATP-binding cassette domain-containing protein [Bacillota bacterium]|nr:ATP-binding cassette domain-containing protein [Bacillota bacterium]
MSIVVENLSLSFNGQPVLKQLSLTLPERGVVCLFGPSGCGKTSLFRCLLGLQKPDHGTISGLNGFRPAVVFQEDRLLPWLSAVDNVALVREGDTARARAALALVELDAAADKLPAELSGGMRRRVAIARALAYDGDPLFLDEPTNGLDADLAARVMQVLTAKRARQLILLITHERALAERYAQQIIELPVNAAAPPA